MEQEISKELAEAREACSSTGCSKNTELVPDKSGRYSRAQQIVAMAAHFPWEASVEFGKPVSDAVAAELTALGVLVEGENVHFAGSGTIPREIVIQIAQESVHNSPTYYVVHADTQALGYAGNRTLGNILFATQNTVDDMIGLKNSWGPDGCAKWALAKHIDQHPAVDALPTGINFSGKCHSYRDVLGLHRVALSYIGRAAFTRPGSLPNLVRERTYSDLRTHFFMGAQSWTRLLKDNSIKGDALVVNQLVSRAARIANGEF
jgi:hypothetical protein